VSISFRKVFGELFFPSFCCNCKALGPYLCEYCYEKLVFYALPIPLNQLPIQELYLDGLQSALEYEETVGSLLHYLKYEHAEDIGEFCAQLLYFSQEFPKVDFISAVPIHSLRKKDRGFNQSEVIAKYLSEYLKIPYMQFLEKKRATRAQATLKNQQDRLHNLDHVFSFSEKNSEFDGAKVLLIDDVCTTGTTLNACANELKKNGISKVFGLTVAHGN